jgi:preprotein translocase SecE subunit
VAKKTKKKGPVARIQGVVSETVLEMKKSNWPARSELIESTMVVIVSVLLMAAFVGVSDKVLLMLLRLLVPVS